MDRQTNERYDMSIDRQCVIAYSRVNYAVTYAEGSVGGSNSPLHIVKNFLSQIVF